MGPNYIIKTQSKVQILMMSGLEWFFQQENKDIQPKLCDLLGKQRKDIQDYLTKELSLKKTDCACYDFTYFLDDHQLHIELKVQKNLQWLDPIKLYCTCKGHEDSTIYLFICIDDQNYIDMILMIIQSALRKVLGNWSKAPWGATLENFISKSCDLFGTEGELSKVQIKCPLYIRELKDYLILSHSHSHSKEWIVYV